MSRYKNEYMIPEVVLNMLDSYIKAPSNTNEKWTLFNRLTAIQNAIQTTLKDR
jgi:hypothetical protein